MTDTTLPFHLKGNYAPVAEEVSAHDLTVQGALPTDLNGLYLRNGPNPMSGSSGHWFLGDGMVHGVKLEGGRASWYRNRWVQTKRLTEPDADRVSAEGQFDRALSYANTHVIRHGGKILALEEGSFPYELSTDLDTVGAHDFDGRLTTAMTAHPKRCAETGELHFFGYGQLEPYLTYHRADAEGRLIQSEEITVGGPTMMHDFGLSRNHVLFMDLPVVFDLDAAMSGRMPFGWSDTYPARVGVMPRGGGDADVQWFEVDPCYVFHPMNAYDDGNTVVFDVCRISELWRRDTDFGDGETTLHRWRFDLDRGTVDEQTLHDRPQDFPRVADDRVGQPYRYGYTAYTGSRAEAGLLRQHDLQAGTVTEHDFGIGRHPGEAVFVPGDGGGEGEGWVLGYVHDDRDDATDLVVLDASAFAGPPIATVRLPQRVPYGFHGSWFADGVDH
ncbi:MAG: carotenoid oxygenase family protein [Actinomycetota bacterium]